MEVRPNRSYGIELGDEMVGAESVRYEVAGVVIPWLSMLLLHVDLLTMLWVHTRICGDAADRVPTRLVVYYGFR
jgi:hypothetical protein